MRRLPRKKPARKSARSASSPLIFEKFVNHNWGFYSHEDPRMHIQTLEKGARTGPKSAKVWLEERGNRVFIPAGGDLRPAEWEKLRAEVERRRSEIEDEWIVLMISKGWLTVERHGSVIYLHAYPGFPGRYTRTFDLMEEFVPDFMNDLLHGGKKLHVDFDKVQGILRVGRQDDPNKRQFFRLDTLLFA